uniref:Class I lanthipeptide n=1 Tax=Chryseobacterium endophyticum TaxID=1854762 RepID=A0AAU6WQL4_9FLAO
MKKLKLNPLSLDKQTIALLDEKQLQEIKGGKTGFSPCPAGATTCDPNGSGEVLQDVEQAPLHVLYKAKITIINNRDTNRWKPKNL